MWRKGMVLAGLCVLGICAGCGQKKSITLEQESVVISDGTEHSDEAGTDQIEADDEETANALPESDEDTSEAEEQEDVQTQEEPSQVTEDGETDQDLAEEPESGRHLTPEELAEYTEWVQDVSNYGFLLSDWENPAQIDLYQVFYCGAGISREGTEDEKQAHMARWDQPEIYTDFWAIDKTDVDALLTEKVGFTYDQLVAEGNRGMEENYYAETDSFCVEAGDTNYCRFLCTDGAMNEDGTTVTLYCDGDDWVRTCEVKVSIEAGQRRFLSNHIEEGWFLNTETYSEAQE